MTSFANQEVSLGRRVTQAVALLVFASVLYGSNVSAVDAAAPCTQLKGYLSSGAASNTDALTNGEVTKLQAFLYSQGLLDREPTGFFGPVTEAGVKKLQSQEGLVSSGSPSTTGYGGVGPGTRALIARLSCSSESPTVVLPSSNPATADLGTTTPISVVERPIGVDTASHLHVTELSFNGGSVSRPITGWTVHIFCPPGVSVTTAEGAVCGETRISPPAWLPGGITFVKRFYIRNISGSLQEVPVTVFAKNSSNSAVGTTNLTLSVPVTTTSSLSSDSQVVVLTPNGGESYTAGKTIDVTWQTGAGVFSIATSSRADIALIGGGRVLSFKNLINDRAETIKIPSDFAAGEYRVRVSVSVPDGSSVTDESDKSFTVYASPQSVAITLVTPKAGEVWRVGKRVLAQWQALNAPSGATVTVIARGAKGVTFEASTTIPPGNSMASVGFDVPPLVCPGPCVATSTPVKTELAGPYDLIAYVYAVEGGASVPSVFAHSAPVRVTVAGTEVLDQGTLKVTGKEIASNLGATIVSIEVAYYSVSGTLKASTTMLELTCPASLSVHYRYQSGSVCGQVLTMTEVGKGALYRSIFEISNTTKLNQLLTGIAKVYDQNGQLVASAPLSYSVRPTGSQAADVISFGQPSTGAQFSYNDDITVSWSAYSGDFDYYVLEAGNIGGDAIAVMVPFIQKSESSVRVLASDVSRRVGSTGYSAVAVDGYYFRVTAIRGYGYIGSGQTGLFSIKQQTAAIPGTLSDIASVLEALKQSLTALLQVVR